MPTRKQILMKLYKKEELAEHVVHLEELLKLWNSLSQEKGYKGLN